MAATEKVDELATHGPTLARCRRAVTSTLDFWPPSARFGVAVLAVFVGLGFGEVSDDLPSDSKIVDYHSPAGQIFIPLASIPPIVVQAFLAAEDDDFYRHGAVDFPMMLRAMALDVLRFDSGRRPLGASTITQQLVKNLVIGDKLSINRKIREAILAFRVERRLTKDRILEIYLNEIQLGCRSRGGPRRPFIILASR